MLAGSQIEIFGDTESFLAERVVEGTRAVHPSESRASQRPARAIAGGGKSLDLPSEVGLKRGALGTWGAISNRLTPDSFPYKR